MKNYSRKRELLALKKQLLKAKAELSKALEMTTSIAVCCESSIQDLYDELNRQLAITEQHLNSGIDEEDLQ